MAMRRDRKWMLAIGIALFIIGFSYGVYQSFREMQGAREPGQVLPEPESARMNMNGDSLYGEGISDGTDLLDFWTGVSPDSQTGPDASIDQRDEAGLQGSHPLTEDEGDVFYLGIYHDRVAVFEGVPSLGRVYRVTDRSIDSLPPREVASLRSGVRVVGEREMLQALEGYMQ